MKTGIEIISEERRRQVEVENWLPSHDAMHTDGELAQAAMAYASPATSFHGDCKVFPSGDKKVKVFVERTFFWPWDEKWWKPTPENRIKELAKAGALIAAEIDRLLNEVG